MGIKGELRSLFASAANASALGLIAASIPDAPGGVHGSGTPSLAGPSRYTIYSLDVSFNCATATGGETSVGPCWDDSSDNVQVTYLIQPGHAATAGNKGSMVSTFKNYHIDFPGGISPTGINNATELGLFSVISGSASNVAVAITYAYI